MNEIGSLRKNISWSFLGNIIFSFSQWLVLIILTKLVSVDEVGEFTYAIAFTAPIVLFFQLQLRSVQITDTKNEHSFSYYFNLRILTSSLSLVIIAILCIIFNFDFSLFTIILCVALMKLSDTVSDIIYGLFQKNERMKYVAISRIIHSILTIIVYTSILLIYKNLQIAILSIVITKLLIIIFVELRYAKTFESIYFVFNYRVFHKLIKIALPLGIMSTLMSLDSNIPRYVLQGFEGSESLGYFSTLAYINMIGGQMILAVSQTVAPRLAKYYVSNKNEFKKLLIKVSLLGTLIGVFSLIFMLLFGETFITILYSEDYAKHMDVFMLIMIAGLINYSSSFLGTAITAARAFRIQPYLGFIWIFFSVTFSMMFIPFHGLYGAGIVLICSSIVGLVSKIIVIRRLLRNEILPS